MIIHPFTTSQGNILPDAHLKIAGITTTPEDYEYYETISEQVEKVSYIIRYKNRANVYVYVDGVQMENRAHPEDWFSFEFEYDQTINENIYTTAYGALETMLRRNGGN